MGYRGWKVVGTEYVSYRGQRWGEGMSAIGVEGCGDERLWVRGDGGL